MSDAEQCKLLSWQQIENCFQEEIKGADWGNYDTVSYTHLMYIRPHRMISEINKISESDHSQTL